MSGHELQMILLSALPFTEVKFTIPIAIAQGMNPAKALLLGSLGNALPIVPLLLLLKPIGNLLERIPYLAHRYNLMLDNTREKSGIFQRYGALGVMLFVAAPLPGTGVYAGIILAFILGLRLLKACVALIMGTFMSAIQVTIASMGIMGIYQFVESLKIMVILLVVGTILCYGVKRLAGKRNFVIDPLKKYKR